MSIFFSPSGTLNVAMDASDLPESQGQNSVSSGAMVRCKNLRTNEAGKAKTRDGSTKLNASAINSAIWWIEEQSGTRYTFAGTLIYENETSIATGLTSAAWSAIKYNAFNDSQLNIFALNGTDRKRIQNSVVREWGIEAPTVAPTFSQGQGLSLTGTYNAKYTYVRKSGDTVVVESDPSPAGDDTVLTGGSLSVDITPSTDPQVTHYRLYRTLANGDGLYYYDQDIIASVTYIYGKAFDWEVFELDTTAVSTDYDYGYTFSFETDDSVFGSSGYKWSTEDDTHSTENAYSWEEFYTAEVLFIEIDPTAIDEAIGSSFGASSLVTVTATNAVGTVTYAWSKISGDVLTISSPSSASTYFIADGMADFESRTAVFRCTVSDSQTTETVDISVTITLTSGGA